MSLHVYDVTNVTSFKSSDHEALDFGIRLGMVSLQPFQSSYRNLLFCPSGQITKTKSNQDSKTNPF